MPGGRQRHQFQCITVIGLLQHVEGLAEAQVAEDVHGQVVAPVGHVLGRRPALLLAAGTGTDLVAKGPHIGEDVTLHLLHGIVGEAVGQDAALPRVQGLVAGIVCVGSRVHEGVVELGLAHIGLETVDLLQGRVGVEGEAVGAETDDLAVRLVQAPELEVPVALPGVVQLVGIGNLGQERAGVSRQRVEVKTVDDDGDDLGGSAGKDEAFGEGAHIGGQGSRQAQEDARQADGSRSALHDSDQGAGKGWRGGAQRRQDRSPTALSVHEVCGSRGLAPTVSPGTGVLYETGSAGNGPWKLVLAPQGG